jgi:electron transfer flavoprotein alpha subunit
MQRMTVAPEFRGVMVYLEQSDGKLAEVSLELLGKAQELASRLAAKVTAVILGYNVGKLAGEAVQFGADYVLIADLPVLERYTTDAFSNALGQIVKEQKPEILLLGATHDGRDLAGRLAVRLNTGLMAHACQVDIEPETNLLVCGVPGFGGSIVAICKCPRSRPQMATVAPGVFSLPQKNPRREGRIEDVKVNPGEVRTKVVERSVEEGADLTRAEVVVIAGRGAEREIDAVRKLAETIGGAVGVTRPLADKELMPRDHQIGSTGYSVSPKVAMVFGASGAAHFVSGILGAKTVISVNRDPAAPINSHADFVVVDDVKNVLPALVSKVGHR